jgi:cytidylate kinase
MFCGDAKLIRVITIEREFGAGGTIIAEKLAQRLGWKLWDHELTEEIARMAKVDTVCVERLDERCDSRFYRLMKVFMRGSYERSMPVAGIDAFDADSMVAFMGPLIERLAAEGNCVIVGRGAPYFLRAREDAFHVFVYAPWDEKVRRVRASGKSEEEAVELVSTIDEERSTFIQRYFGKEWPNRHLYHLMINSKIGEDVVVRAILNQVSELDQLAPARPISQSRN